VVRCDENMDKTTEIYKIISSVIIGFLANIYDKYSVMLAFMSFAIIFDVITGLVKSKCIGEKISSKRGTKGFFKKLVFIIAYAFGVFLDLFVPYVISATGSDIEVECYFGLIIGAYITLNESISICENLYACNSDIIPSYIMNILNGIKDKINNKK
jgi:toxin secretion/phage lysis holin